MGSELIPYSDVEKMGNAIAKSKLFGMKTPEEAIALMLVAQAEGLHPVSAARDYNIILGKPALKADAILARFQNAGGSVDWDAMTDARVAGKFTHPTACPKGITIDWDMKRATTAGFAGKDNWKKFPRQMLRARVISEGVRACYPASCAGVYTPEEVQDFSEEPKAVKAVVKEDPKPAAPAPVAKPVPLPVKEAEVIPQEPDNIEDALTAEEKAAFFGGEVVKEPEIPVGYQTLVVETCRAYPTDNPTQIFIKSGGKDYSKFANAESKIYEPGAVLICKIVQKKGKDKKGNEKIYNNIVDIAGEAE
jgi:hypothetical protein